jgi:hypothetical protein
MCRERAVITVLVSTARCTEAVAPTKTQKRVGPMAQMPVVTRRTPTSRTNARPRAGESVRRFQPLHPRAIKAAAPNPMNA